MVFSERVRNYGSRGKGVSARDNHIIKGMKALHLLAALAWAGGAFSMQALGFLKLGMDDPATVKLVEYCRYIVDSWVVMPGLIGCVLTGLFYSIFTSLGFFKFAWVTFKWIISFCAGFWGTFFWLPVGDRCIEWLTPMGLDWPLRFVRSCILPEELWASLVQVAIIFAMALISIYRPLTWKMYGDPIVPPTSSKIYFCGEPSLPDAGKGPSFRFSSFSQCVSSGWKRGNGKQLIKEQGTLPYRERPFCCGLSSGAPDGGPQAFPYGGWDVSGGGVSSVGPIARGNE